MFKKRNSSPPPLPPSPPPPIVIPTAAAIPAESVIVDVATPAPATMACSLEDNPDYQIIIQKLKMDILLYIRKINYDIGYYWWKAYIYSAFWNQISTPINLVIMILTALTTGHSVTDGILSNSNNTALGLATLIISIFNTFFRPGQQMNLCKDNMAKWYKMGIEFEKIYYSKFQDFNAAELSKKVDELQKIFNDINELKRTQETNFLIDLIFLIAKYYFIRRNLTWIPQNKTNAGAGAGAGAGASESPHPIPEHNIEAPLSNQHMDQTTQHSENSEDSDVHVPVGGIMMDSTNMFARNTGITVQCRDIAV